MSGSYVRKLGAKAKLAVTGCIEAAPGQPHAADLECTVCTSPAFDTPVKTTSCGHIFHKHCLQDWLKDKAGAAHNCPACRKELPPGAAAFTEVDRFVVSILDGTEVHCPQDCEAPRLKRMRYEKLAGHILDDCPETPLLCRNEKCEEVLPRREMEGAHAADCPHGLVPCEQCHEKVPRGMLLAHKAGECLHRHFTCAYCGKSGLLYSCKDSHELECAGPVPMRVAAELRQQNKELREHNALLQDQFVGGIREGARQFQDFRQQQQQQSGLLLDFRQQVAGQFQQQKQELQYLRQHGGQIQDFRQYATGMFQQQTDELHEMRQQNEQLAEFRQSVTGLLQQQKQELQEVRQQNKHLLQLVQATLCPECPCIQVRSQEWAQMNGKYTIRAERRNGHCVWGKPCGHFVFKSPNGNWMIAGSRKLMDANKAGFISTKCGVNYPSDDLEWEMWDGNAWQPAPGTYVQDGL